MRNHLQLSIIVPVYNVEQYLERCVNSLLNQDIDMSEYEIILVNDGSTDRSYEIAKKMASLNSNICVYTQDNQGQGIARNVGIDHANGEYIMFVDSDDQLYPNVLQQFLGIAESNGLDVVASRMMMLDEFGNEHIELVQPFQTDVVFCGEYALLHGVHIASVCTNVYRREFLNNTGLRFTKGIYHEDVDFNLRMYAFAHRIMFTDLVTYSYTYNPESTDRKLTKEKLIRSYQSEFIISQNIRCFSALPCISVQLREFYKRHSNSSMVSCLVNLIRSRQLNSEDKKSVFKKMKEEGLYPLRGRTLSWKTTCVIPLLNKEKLVVFLFRC